MQVKQIYELVNFAQKSILGEQSVLEEDLSNLASLGDELSDPKNIDNYVRSLVDQIGKIIFVNRPYASSIPSVLMDSWEFGSVLEKVTGDLYDAEENEEWELQDGAVYDQQQFYKPVATAKFYNTKVTFEIPISITRKQVKESFQTAEQLNSFISMIYNDVDKSMTVKIDGLVMRTIDTAIGHVLKNGKATQKVNLLKLYKADHPETTLTATTAITDPEFLRFATLKLKLTANRLSKMTRLFNTGGKARFTTKEYLHTILLNEFKEGAGVYLYDANGQFNTDNIKLIDAETVPYWQGSGEDYSFAETSKVNVKLPDGTVLNQSGILGIMFDRDAIAVCNHTREARTAPFNAKGNFYNTYFTTDNSYIIDTNENIVVFYVADGE